MKHLVVTTLLCLTVLFVKAQNSKQFKKLLKENQLEFEQPEEFTKTKVVDNGDLYYDYAIKLKTDSFEVRFTIFPLTTLKKEYEESLSDTSKLMLDPNKYHKSMFMANILNVSQSGMENMPSISDFPLDAVKKEFGADYGANSFFEMDSEFGKGYKYCLMMMIHKTDVADVYVSFLGNDRDKFEEYMLLAFHTVAFK